MSVGFSSVENPAAAPQAEPPQLKIYKAPPEHFVDGLIRSNSMNDKVLVALGGLCSIQHDALMRLIETPKLLESRDPEDRQLVKNADAFLSNMVKSINALHAIDPTLPVLAELMECYEKCRSAFPTVFRDQDY